MKRMLLAALLVGCFSTAVSSISPMTQIMYDVEEIGAGRWQYTYIVTNINLVRDGHPSAILEFTIWFDEPLFDDLNVATSSKYSKGWDELVWQPEPVLGDAGGYDVRAVITNQGILPGQSAFGFSVVFDWLGEGRPGSQKYEIIDASTFKTIETGYTVPEPMTIMLLGLGGAAIGRKRRGCVN